MLLIRCPHCEEVRPEIEFRYAGEAHVVRVAEPARESDAAWAGFLYLRANPKGWHRERWQHVHGCRRFFNVLRNTVSDRIAATYKPGEPRAEPPVGEGDA